MNKKMSKRQRDLKAKLMAAICMLLVSSIMMVSTTYAWFTLSTAPEVTGITTAVGANGNLEMALLPSDAKLDSLDKTHDEGGIDSGVQTSVAATQNYKVSNITWGNLVDLTNGYGLDQISLYPSALILDDAETHINTGAYLQAPVYGADGRVEKLDPVAGFGVYQDTAFVESNGWGVRAIGTAANMTPRESSFRMARANINTYISSAKGNISTALNAHGTVLADPVLKEAMGSTPTYGQAQVDGLDGLVEGLEAALVNVEKAYMNAILAYAASSLNTADNSDGVWEAVAAVVNAEGATLASVKAAMGNISVTGLDKYDNLVETVQNLRTEVNKLNGNTITETEFNAVAKLLADPANMEVGGYTAAEIKADKDNKVSELMGLATSGKLVVTLASGGAFAEFADHMGAYSAAVKIQSVGMNTTMQVNTSVAGGGYLPAAHTALQDKEPVTDTANTTKTLSDFYGYVIDMAFRTNAADSDLMLQIDPIDRIYSDNSSEATMGGGSYMEFTSGSPTFALEQMENLLNAIKIVFFNPADGEIIANAYLDTENAETNGNVVRAEIHMEGGSSDSAAAGFAHHEGSRYYGTVSTADGSTDNETVVTYTYTSKDGVNQLQEVVTKTVIPESTDPESGDTIPAETTWGDSTYYKYENSAFATTPLTDADTIAALKVMKHSDGERIMSLTQNTAAAVSVLVYLDGENVTNADVAFDSAKSMTGTMNLQFCSSANLVPMQYGGALELPEETTPPAEGDDNTQSGGGNGDDNDQNGQTPTVSVATDSAPSITLSDTTVTDGSCSFTLLGAEATKTYSVTYSMGADVTDEIVTESNGTYTINGITENVIVKVTEIV